MLVHLQEQPLRPLVVVGRTRIHLLQGGRVAKVIPAINCVCNKRTSLVSSLDPTFSRGETVLAKEHSSPPSLNNIKPKMEATLHYTIGLVLRSHGRRKHVRHGNYSTSAISYPMPVKLTADTQQLGLHVGYVAVKMETQYVEWCN